MKDVKDYIISKSPKVESLITEKDLKSLLGFPIRATSGVVKITPEQAIVILQKCNVKNRPVSKARVEQYKKSMELGYFKLSNDMITFSDAVLTNGQHRLMALALTDKPQKFYISFIVESFMGMDTVKTRSVKDNALLSDNCDERLKDKKMGIIHGVIRSAFYFNTGEYMYTSKLQNEYVQTANKYANQLITLRDAGIFNKITISMPIKKKVISSNTVYSAFFLAYISGVDIEVINHIREVLRSGLPNTSYDRIIIRLRDLLFSLDTLGGADSGKKIQMAVQECIYKVANKSKSTKLKVDKYYYIVKDL